MALDVQSLIRQGLGYTDPRGRLCRVNQPAEYWPMSDIQPVDVLVEWKGRRVRLHSHARVVLEVLSKDHGWVPVAHCPRLNEFLWRQWVGGDDNG